MSTYTYNTSTWGSFYGTLNGRHADGQIGPVMVTVTVTERSDNGTRATARIDAGSWGSHGDRTYGNPADHLPVDPAAFTCPFVNGLVPFTAA